jgi:transposase-like protein
MQGHVCTYLYVNKHIAIIWYLLHLTKGQVNNDFIQAPQRFKAGNEKANTRTFPGVSTIKLKLRHETYTTQDCRTQYQRAYSEVRKKLQKAKENRIQDKCINIDKGMTTGSSKKAGTTLKTLTKNNPQKASV